MDKFSLSKGVGLLQASSSFTITKGQQCQHQWNILRHDVSFPAACLHSTRLDNNIRWMEEFIRQYPTAKHAPHGKTSMCPKLFHKQLQAEGTWGMTLATVHQVRVAAHHGVKHVLLANQLVGRTNMEMIADILKSDPMFRFICIVDSVPNLQTLGKFIQGNDLRLDVLLEIGTPQNGRTGLRTLDELAPVLAEIQRWKNTIQLVGIEFFEGVLPSAEVVRQFIQSSVVQMLGELFELDESPFVHDEIILSGGGSAYFDVVAEELAKIRLPTKFLNRVQRNHKLVILLRAGCYLTQDVGIYKAAHERMQAQSAVVAGIKSPSPSLVPALQVWAYIQSKPESGLVVIGMGQRDVSFDLGLPEPALLSTSGNVAGKPENISGKGWTVTKLMDQHAFMRIDTTTAAGQKDFDTLHVGDLIAFDIRHPCMTFDKWRTILLIDDEYNVLDVLETYF